jgi:riboflavin transporter FmnP
MEQNENVLTEKSVKLSSAEEGLKVNLTVEENLAAEENHAEEKSAKVTAESKKEKKSFGKALGGYFTATRITYIAVFTALAYVLYLFDFALLPSTPVSFLKLDFSNTFVMIAGFALGPVAGVIVGVLKELIHALTVGNTAFVGELANILFVLPYMLIPAIIYKKHKGIKTVIVSLLLGCLAQCIVSVPINYFLNFPAFMLAFGGTWEGGMELYLTVWYWAVLFNLIKTLLVSVAVILIYKPLSNLIKLTNKKFASIKKK